MPWRADERDDLLGQLGAADDQVGQRGVVLVVDQRRAVDARAVEAGGTGDRDRGGVVPLVLPAGVDVGVGEVAHDAHDLDAGRAHGHQLGVDLGGQGLHERRRTGAADRDPRAVGRAGRHRRGVPVLNVSPSAGCATAPATRSPSCHSATCTAQSSRGGSENSRVPSSGSMIQTREALEADLVVGRLLAQHRVVGAVLAQHARQDLLGGRVAGVLEGPALEAALVGRGAHLEEDGTGLFGRPDGEGVVVELARVGALDWSQSRGQPSEAGPGAPTRCRPGSARWCGCDAGARSSMSGRRRRMAAAASWELTPSLLRPDLDVAADGRERDAEAGGDVRHRLAVGHPLEDVELARATTGTTARPSPRTGS